MGVTSEAIAYGFLVASYRRRMGIVAVREMARHRYRQSQNVGLTRLQLDEIGRERDLQRQGARAAGGGTRASWRRSAPPGRAGSRAPLSAT